MIAPLAASATLVIQNIVNAMSLGSLYALIALGIALIFGIMQLINFAYGELIMVGGFALYLMGAAAWPVLVVGAVIACVVFALGMERIAFRPVRGADPTTLLVTSFALSYLLQNLATLILNPEPKGVNISTTVQQQLSIGGVRVSKLDVITMVVTIVLLVALATFLRKLPLGVQMRAAAEDFRMARFLGVRANIVIAAAFAISGVFAGVVAVLWVARTGIVTPTMGLVPLLAGVVGAVVGGMASLPGAAIGGFVLGALTIALDAILPPSLRPFRDAFVFGVVIAILLFRPQGIMPARGVIARV